METPLQPSLLAPCSGQAVQLPVPRSEAVSSAGVGLWRMAEQASHTTRAGLPCPQCCSAAIPGSPRAPGPGSSVPRRPSPGSAGTRGTFSSSSISTLMNGCSTELWEHFPEA